MKYKFWDEYSDAKRLYISKKESFSSSNSGMTLADYKQIIEFLINILDEYIVEELEDEWMEENK